MSLNAAASTVSRPPNKRGRSLALLSKSLRFPTPDIGSTLVTSGNAEVHWTGALSPDLMVDVAERVYSWDVLSLSLTCSFMRHLLRPILYETMVLRSSKLCKSALKMLDATPENCSVVRKIAVRPNYYLAWPKLNEPLDEVWVADMVEKIAPRLISLQTFDWDGLEMPRDTLWKTLRASCPLLRNVYSNIGTRPVSPASELFQFSNLSCFSLTVRHGLGGNELFVTAERLPKELWDMLTLRCPDLEELTVCSYSSYHRTLDIQSMMDARWPKLSSLTLGAFSYQSDFTLPDCYQLGKFLEAHPTLKQLRLAWNFKRWLSPDSVPLHLGNSHPSNIPDAAPRDVRQISNEEHVDVLPHLSSFVGIFQQLSELPNLEPISELDLTCEPIYDTRIVSLCPILARCINLTGLDLWVHIPENRDLLIGSGGTGLMREVLEQCPNLEEFHFMCTTPFDNAALQDLASMLHLLPRLRTFSLTKGHKYSDESMLESVLRILRTKDNGALLPLQQINIRWAREKCMNHLKQDGTYDITRDPLNRSRIIRLDIKETGITLFGTTFARRYRYRSRDWPAPPAPTRDDKQRSLIRQHSSAYFNAGSNGPNTHVDPISLVNDHTLSGTDNDQDEDVDNAGGIQEARREGTVRRMLSSKTIRRIFLNK